MIEWPLPPPVPSHARRPLCRQARRAAPLPASTALIRRRVQVEVEWFIALADEPASPKCPPFARGARASAARWSRLLRADARRIKEIERDHQPRRQGGRVLAQGALRGDRRARPRAGEFVHFACTSEDINNTSHALMLKRGARPRCCCRRSTPDRHLLRAMAHAHADARCSRARTARPRRRPRSARRSPTSWRGSPRRASDRRGALLAKMNGAVGNYNAHLAAYPDVDWEALARVRRAALGLEFNPYTTRSSRTTGWPSCSTRWRAQHDPDRLRSRHLGLHQPRLLPAAAARRRGRLVDDAAQGQPDRLRERRGQPRPRQRAAAPPGREAADLALAARPHRLHGAAQHGRRARLHAARPTTSLRAGLDKLEVDAAARGRPRRELGSAGRADPDGDAAIGGRTR